MKPKKLKLPLLYRSVEVELVRMDPAEGAEEGAPAQYELTVSSEFPVARYFGKEILSHTKGAVDLTLFREGAAVLLDHFGPQIGVVVRGWLDTTEKKLRAVIQFSRSQLGQEIEQDVIDKVRRWISVGYQPIRAILSEQGETEAENVYTVTRWFPKEVSVTAIPADHTVGFSRSGDQPAETYEVEVTNGARAGEVVTMFCTHVRAGQPVCDTCAAAGISEVRAAPAPTPTPTPTPTPAPTPAPVIDVGAVRRETAEILRIAQANGVSDQAAGWLERGLTLDQVSTEILRLRATTPTQTPSGDDDAPAAGLEAMPEADRRNYSYARAIRCSMLGRHDGLEGEVHQHLASNQPEGYQTRGGIHVPMRLLTPAERRRDMELMRRNLDSGTAGYGAETVFDQPGEFIEMLRNKAVLASRGARILSGLTAPVPFPKQTGSATAYWTGENPASGVSKTKLATGIVSLTPKTLIALTGYSRQLIMQASNDTEAMVRDDFAAVHGLEVDRVGMHGLGASGEPMGVYNAADVGAKAMGGVPDFVKLTAMVGQLASANAHQGSTGWITTNGMAAKLMATPTISSAAAGFLWSGRIDSGTVAGYGASASNQVLATMGGSSDEHGLVFGNWADMLIGLWGSMEIIVDPYKLKEYGLIEVSTFQMADVMLRHPESFVKATGAKIA